MYPVFLSDFNLPKRFSRNTHTSNFMNIHPVGAKLFHADRQTDTQMDGQTGIMKLIVIFHILQPRPKTYHTYPKAR